MIDILLVDDQKILLEGLRKIFEPAPEIAVCATCALAELAEEACLRYRPDLVLMDICMESRTSGIRICRRLKERFPAIRVVMMTGMSELAFVGWAKDAGADSFIYKEASGEAFRHPRPGYVRCGGGQSDGARARDPATRLPEPLARGNRGAVGHREAHGQFPHRQHAREDGPQEHRRPCRGGGREGPDEHGDTERMRTRRHRHALMYRVYLKRTFGAAPCVRSRR